MDFELGSRECPLHLLAQVWHSRTVASHPDDAVITPRFLKDAGCTTWGGGFPKSGVLFWGVNTIRTIVYWGSILGSPSLEIITYEVCKSWGPSRRWAQGAALNEYSYDGQVFGFVRKWTNPT